MWRRLGRLRAVAPKSPAAAGGRPAVEAGWLTPKAPLPRCERLLERERWAVRSKPLSVPPGIPRPPYAASGLVRPSPGVSAYEVKNAAAIRRMRAAAAVAAEALQTAVDATAAGATGLEVEEKAHALIVARGAFPSPLNFHGFPASLVVSVNDEVCHGIPTERPFRPGDLVKYDCIVFYGGVHGDCAASVVVPGKETAATPAAGRAAGCAGASAAGGAGGCGITAAALASLCRRARDAAVAACGPGAPFAKVADVVEAVARDGGCRVVAEFSAHFIGRDLHMPPLIPHVSEGGARAPAEERTAGPRMRTGNTFTIEPILVSGSADVAVAADGWTVVTADGGWGAQFEHTILVTDSGAEVLTPLRD